MEVERQICVLAGLSLLRRVSSVVEEVEEVLDSPNYST